MSTLLDIRTYGDPVLREEATRVQTVTAELRQLAKQMLESMRAAKGVGIAAQQVGRTESVCIVEILPEYDVEAPNGPRLNPQVEMPLTMFNPELMDASEDEVWTMEEGCLSFPGIQGNVERPWRVKVRYLGLDGVTHEVDLQGYAARAAQHEMDHLSGKLFVDRFSHVKKLAVKGKLRRLREETLDRTGGGNA